LDLAGCLLPLLPDPGRGVIALVGAGGKTAALFALGEELAFRVPGSGVLLTTTTHLFDPRLEPGRLFDELRFAPELAGPPAQPADGPAPWAPDSGPEPPAGFDSGGGRGFRRVLAAGALAAEGRLRGIHPSRVAGLARSWPYVVVEADGSKRSPVKAPAGHEPALPPGAGLVLGVIGLGCLGQPMAEPAVHRPERFGPLTGCAPGAPIGPEHLAALCRSPLGLFKGVPAGTPRVLLLNQADRFPGDPAGLLRGFRGCAELALLAVLACPDPAGRVLAVA
jgi:hypothetical protein